MLKRQSTTVKVTSRIRRLISYFCETTGSGVMCRVGGEEFGVFGRLFRYNTPKNLCIYKRTLEQIEAILCRFLEFGSSLRIRYLGETETDFVYTVDSVWRRHFLLVSTATWLARDPLENWWYLDNLPKLFELTETGFRLKCGVHDEQFKI